ncbi:unnamed protein product [Dracunculus medinensis]|uniref:guanylate cyclase n=1 Tax=Dracunculus medinensis TaxID=318479 RepID=A0A158Q620_DRAME|nr:unnamed protein product [Dracunculus medinensis]
MRLEFRFQFGFIHECMRQMIIRNYGAKAWTSILRRAGFSITDENIVNLYYSDSSTFAIVDAILWEMYGKFHIEYIIEIGWEELVQTISPDLRGLLNNIDSLHYFISRIIYKSEWKCPSFHCEQNKDGSLTLDYRTYRNGIYPTVKDTSEDQLVGRSAHLSQYDFVVIFPYHLLFDKDCKLLQVGKELYNHICRDLLEIGTPLTQIFQIVVPRIIFDFENICIFRDSIFVLEIKDAKFSLLLMTIILELINFSSEHQRSFVSFGRNLGLKGQMIPLDDNNQMLFLCSPLITTIPDLLEFGMRLTAMPLHDANRDLILLNQQRISDEEMNKQLQENNAQLEGLARDLEAEKGKTEELLKEMLPASVATQLLHGKSVDACEFNEATVMFSDVPNFNNIVPNCEPKEIVALLNDLFTKFDRLVVRHGAYKVETVGDSYMTVGGVPEIRLDHCEIICDLALGMLWESHSVTDPIKNAPLQIRIGIHSGTVVAGVIGNKMPRYCLFGDTVNTASRMESHSVPGRIHCTREAVELRNGQHFQFIMRGKIQVKGKGLMNTYFLKSNNKKTIWEIIGREKGKIVFLVCYQFRPNQIIK